MKESPNIPALYLPLWWLLKGLSLLPLSALYAIGYGLYLLIYRVVGYRKKVVLQNLRNSFPERSEAEIQGIAKAFYRQFVDVVVEIVKLTTISPSEMRQRVTFYNPEVLEQFVQAGKPVIILGSHVGNWEWCLSAASLRFNFPAEGVYRPLKNPFFEEYMIHIRSRLGARLIKMKDTMRDFIRHRQVPRVVALLSDQTPPYGEIQHWTTFLHQDTPFFVGAEKLANSFGYPVLYLDVRRLKRGHYELAFEVLTDGTHAVNEGVYPITDAFAQKLEATLQRNPADYLWTHKRWKHKRV
ncbi:lysophospholipid acyltransferase family protein [Pontibacter indicus]|uniref:lysophospholipid acyltransferase family protein n=1 Tax=Pontibacter indicus TaxID=1317125 RepID=UPI0009FA7A2A|nr:lysophospholipid acyltransferase family protein [Pontibacter indicus]